MTELTEELDRLLAADAEAGLLTGPNGIDSEEDAMTAAKLAQPLVVNALADWAIDAGSNLVTYLSSAGTEDDKVAEEDEPGRRLFGKRLVPATTAVAVETGLSEGSATSIVDAISACSAKALAQRMAEEELDKQDLAQLLRQERASLVENGWGPWIEMVGRGDHLMEANTVSTPLNSTTNATIGAAAAAVGHDAMSDQGDAVTSTPSDESAGKTSGNESSTDTPESTADSTTEPTTESAADSTAEPAADSKTEPAAEVKAASEDENSENENSETSTAAEDSTKTESDADADAETETSDTDTDAYRGDRWDALAGEVAATDAEPIATSAAEDGGGSNKTPMLIGAACAAVLVGGGLFALLSGGDSETDATTDEAALTGDSDDDQGSDDPATSTTVEADSTPTTEAADSSSGETGDAGETVDVGASEIVQIQVPMTDIKGVSPESGGTADFEFNTETGEICYTFEAVGVDGPFATHIHVGANGIRGGVVVDFGENESPVTGCIDNPPNDTADILAFPGSHYAELHDPSGDFTVRGQLSDEASTEDQRPDLAFTDPDAGGAQAVVESGRIVLRGPIADRATADLLAAEYASLDLAGIDVVDNLEVVSDAPPPSGRVVLTDAILFAVGSSTLGATDQGLIDVLVAVALSEANSTMTIVGHTDDTGSQVANLELSLERAITLRDVLVDAGVPIENLRVEGAGDTDPIGDNATADGRALNRRIEFELKPTVN